MMNNPVDCTGDPETFGTCIRGQNGPKDSLCIAVIPSLLTLLFNLLRFTAHFYTAERLMRAENVENNNDSNSRNRFKSSLIFCCNATRSNLITRILITPNPLQWSHLCSSKSTSQHISSHTLRLSWCLSWQWQGYLGPAGWYGLRRSFGHWESSSTSSFTAVPKYLPRERNILNKHICRGSLSFFSFSFLEVKFLHQFRKNKNPAPLWA